MLDFLMRWLYAVAVGGSVAAFAIGRALGWPLGVVVLAWSVTTLAAGALLERVAPYDADWRHDRRDVPTDATSAAVLIGLVDPLLKAALPVLAALAGAGAAGAWVLDSLPFAGQVLATVLWIELAKYASHRAHHELKALWRLHALHHGSERLYWLNNFRFHPLNHVANTTISLLPLLLLGAPNDVLLGAVALTQPVVMLQHLNVATRNGWLNRIFSTNELHRWHHSTEPAEANANFGSALVIWDQAFGTYRPHGGRPARIGLFGDGGGHPARGPYLQQLLAPFMPACCRA